LARPHAAACTSDAPQCAARSGGGAALCLEPGAGGGRAGGRGCPCSPPGRPAARACRRPAPALPRVDVRAVRLQGARRPRCCRRPAAMPRAASQGCCCGATEGAGRNGARAAAQAAVFDDEYLLLEGVPGSVAWLRGGVVTKAGAVNTSALLSPAFAASPGPNASHTWLGGGATAALYATCCGGRRLVIPLRLSAPGYVPENATAAFAVEVLGAAGGGAAGGVPGGGVVAGLFQEQPDGGTGLEELGSAGGGAPGLPALVTRLPARAALADATLFIDTTFAGAGGIRRRPPRWAPRPTRAAPRRRPSRCRTAPTCRPPHPRPTAMTRPTRTVPTTTPRRTLRARRCRHRRPRAATAPSTRPPTRALATRQPHQHQQPRASSTPGPHTAGAATGAPACTAPGAAPGLRAWRHPG